MKYQVLTLDLTIAATAADQRYIVQPAPGRWKIAAAYFAPATAVSTDGTNYLTSTITSNDGAAGADETVGSHTTLTGGDALVLKTSLAISLTDGTGLELDQGDQIKIAKTEGGTGAALDGAYTFLLEQVRIP